MIVSERFNPYNSKNIQKYSSSRTEIWTNGWKLFKDSPIFGHGQESFAILSKLRGYNHGIAPHNEYLKHLVEFGIIGFVAYCSIFIIIIKNTLVAINKTLEPFGKLLYISYLAGLCGYMIGIFFTNDGPSIYIFWIYTAIICKYAQFDSLIEEKSVFDNYYYYK
jgi:O-antigen ligase